MKTDAVFGPIVSVEWLNTHLNDEHLIVLNATITKVVGNASEIENIQIPNTQFFDIKKEFSNVNAEFPNTIPSEEQFQNATKKLGINTNSKIVVYDDLGIYSSPRAWWLFKAFGFNNVAVLNGGLPEWINKGFNTEAKQENTKPFGNFIASYNPENVVFFNDLETISEDNNYKIIDARSSDRFNCIVPEPRQGLRSGTIPNSLNLPYNQVLNGNTIKSKEELVGVFNGLANKNQHLVFSCGSGITASILALASTIAGYNNSVYDGSWTEYGSLTTDNMSNWSKKELIAYILLYASHSDFKEDNNERNVIISKVDMKTFDSIHKEFDLDNDYQSIQKIISGVEKHNYSKEDLTELFFDLKTLFFADGEFDILEQNMFRSLKRILN